MKTVGQAAQQWAERSRYGKLNLRKHTRAVLPKKKKKMGNNEKIPHRGHKVHTQM
jgi:hypothetical protein